MTLLADIAERWPPEHWRDCHVLVAVSGGADSVALLRLLVETHLLQPGAGEIVVGHFNHQLRGDHSNEDEAFVMRLSDELGIDVVTAKAALPSGPVSEEQARGARYEFLLRAAEKLGARYVATAHTADDQIETVLMRVLRGSGIDGLAGIPWARPLSPSVTLVRPLLGVRRTEIEEYLASLGQSYQTDGSNLESTFTRNWVRGELLPKIRERLPDDPDRAILRLAQQAREWRDAIAQLSTELAEVAVDIELGDVVRRIAFDCSVLAVHPSIVVQQVARHAWRSAGWSEQAMTMSDWERIAAAIAHPDSAAFTLPGDVDARRDIGHLVLARR